MKILVTGGTGFVGMHVVDRLLDRECDVRLLVRPTSRLPSRWTDRLEVFVGDFGDLAPLGDAVAGCDAVINIAHSMGGSRSEIERAAIGGTRRLFAEAHSHGVRRLVHVSSIGVLPMGEAHRGRAMPEEPIYEAEVRYTTDYVFGKIATEKAALDLGKLGDVSVAVIRPGDRVRTRRKLESVAPWDGDRPQDIPSRRRTPAPAICLCRKPRGRTCAGRARRTRCRG